MEAIDKSLLLWKRNAWNNSTQLYGELIDICIKDTQNFANLIDSAEVDTFSKNIVNIFSAANRTLPLIKDLIYNEFNSKVSAEGEGSILRGNNIVNKIEGAYVRLIGANYLRFVLSELVTKVVLDKSLKLEIDPRKLNAYYDEEIDYHPKDVETEIRDNQINLNNVSQMFLDRITDPQVIEEMPREIRAIADYTAESALRYAPESLAPLVGGFIMLRFFSPAIVTPEYSKLLPSDIVPTKKAKRNLVLLAKVLQNASNGVLFGGKEEFMTCMNQFVLSNKEKMENYFTMICKDPLNNNNRWSDLEGIAIPYLVQKINQPTSSGLSKSEERSKPSAAKWLVTTPSTYAPGQSTTGNNNSGGGGGVSSNNKSPPTSSSNNSKSTSTTISTAIQPWDTYIKHVEIQDLFDIHRIFDIYKEKINIKLVPSSKNAVRVLELLKELGPSPKTKIEKKKKEVENNEEWELNNQSNSLNSAFDDFTHMLERARFLFQGPNDKNDNPVFYLIVNRVKPEVFDNVNPLIAHIFKVMDVAVNNTYTLVVDMSWAHIDSNLKKSIFTHLPKLAEVFSRKYKKNIDKIFIVHPSAYTRAVIYFMSAFTSRKLKRKIHEIYNWKQLTSFIDTENIALPETSKDYITKSYRVVKVNSKGKRQERLIKFTSNSLLNIDPKTHRIQNEKRIDEIEEIASKLGSIEISMKFGSADNSSFSKSALSNRIGFLSLTKSSNVQTDSPIRKYVCNHELERDHILQDIFEAGFKLGLSKIKRPSSPTSTSPTTSANIHNELPNEYRVIKVNNAGKHQERIFKLTIDSLLNLDQQRIKSENSFAGIEEVLVDTENEDVVWMKYKSEPHRRKIICNKGEGRMLCDVLTEAIHKYQKSIDLQEGALKLDAEETSYL
eukprot:gene1368-1726_t